MKLLEENKGTLEDLDMSRAVFILDSKMQTTKIKNLSCQLDWI